MPNGQGTVLSHAVGCALAGGCSKVFVTTDNPEIRSVAEGAGASVISRVPAMAVDSVGTQNVAADALREIGADRQWPVVVIYPCTPLLTAADVIFGFERLERRPEGYVITVGKFGHPIHRALEWTDNGTMRMAMPQFEDWTSDKLPARYFDAGQCYWGLAGSFMDGLPLYENAIPSLLKSWEAVDINWPEDWELATRIMRGSP